jgi:hypothetical protein
MSNSLGGNQELVCMNPILFSPNWGFGFHVHIDASQLTIEAIFAQKPNW